MWTLRASTARSPLSPSSSSPARPWQRTDPMVWGRIRNSEAIRHLGPGLITGAADDDPSGIATYSQAGAQFGFNMLWTVVFTYPLMVGIQTVSARMGRITGEGLAANIRKVFPRPVL